MTTLGDWGCARGSFVVAVALVACSGSADTGAGPQTTPAGGAAGTTVNTGGTAGASGSTGTSGAAGTTVNAGGAAGTAVNAGGAAGTAVNAGGAAGTTVNAGGAAGGSSGAAGATGGGSGAAGAGDGGVKAGCTLVWSDEFDGPAGSQPDATKWNLIDNCKPYNGELECYTSRADNVSLDGQGHMLLTARREAFGGKSFTSGRVESQHKFEHTYGRWEARIKLPVAKGLWPAYWMLGNDIDTALWPKCGEIDIFENRGMEPNTLYAVMHGPNHNGTGRLGTGYTMPTNVGADFHVAAAEWQENVVRIYVDDVLRTTVTSTDSGQENWVWNHPFFVVMNVAIGGGFPGPVDANAPFPMSMVVDYVRVCDFAP